MKSALKEKRVLLIAFLAIAVVLFAGWRYPMVKPNSWNYKIVPVNGMTQGEQVLKDMDAQGWEFIAVQPMRTQAELIPKMQSAQSAQNRPAPQGKTAPIGQPEALYFFRRAK
jgi:hypothetical protein